MQMIIQVSLLTLTVLHVAYANKYGCPMYKATELMAGPQKCKDVDGNEHRIGDTWRTKDCKNCECYDYYHACCDLKPQYVDWKYAPDGCTSIWNTLTCEEEFVLEYDENIPCPYTDSK
ncbi:beta-microseminoprotein-like [Antedon mediterranea]|uniref:beta-microseminoprotein-like n=1 Tax=Antedon mediterranea TaxID=105859 RepID=UPI003AF46C28